MRILMVGDIYGRPGRDMLRETLAGIRRQYAIDFTIVNGENAAAGFGLTRSVYDEIRTAGADVVTLGNHTWDKREILEFIDAEPELLRP
ncbi:metallophosphoesterase, partial [mine drainage metagenome]